MPPQKLNVNMPPAMEQSCFQRAEALLVRMIEEDREFERRVGYEEITTVEFGTLAAAIVRLLHCEKVGLTRDASLDITTFQPLLDEIWNIIRRERLKAANTFTGELN